MIFIAPGESRDYTFVDLTNPEIRSVIVGDGPLMASQDEKLLEIFTMVGGIPRRCFQALFEDELERKRYRLN
jgi:hypothetical protein